MGSRKRKTLQEEINSHPQKVQKTYSSEKVQPKSHDVLRILLEFVTPLPDDLLTLTLEYDDCWSRETSWQRWVLQWKSLQKHFLPYLLNPLQQEMEKRLPRPNDLVPLSYVSLETSVTFDLLVSWTEPIWDALLSSNAMNDGVQDDVRLIPLREREELFRRIWDQHFIPNMLTVDKKVWFESFDKWMTENNITASLPTHPDYAQSPLRHRSMAFIALYFFRCRGYRGADCAVRSLYFYFQRLFGKMGAAFLLWIALQSCINKSHISNLSFPWTYNQETLRYENYTEIQFLCGAEMDYVRKADFEALLQAEL